MENWVLKSLGKVRNEVQSRLEKKLHFLRDRKIKEQESQKTLPKHKLDKKVVYNNSEKTVDERTVRGAFVGSEFWNSSEEIPTG